SPKHHRPGHQRGRQPRVPVTHPPVVRISPVSIKGDFMKLFPQVGVAAAAAATCLAFSGAASAQAVKIGVVETLSGPQAASGLMYRTAARYAVERINAQGGWNGQP